MNVLSLSGGGMRGIYSLGVLSSIQNREPVTQHTDLFIGTSTGAILAACLAFEKKPEELKDLYLKHAKTIFNIPLKWKLKGVFGLGGAQYPIWGLQQVLEEFFGDLTLGQAPHRFMTVAYDTKSASIILFDSANEKWKNTRVVDAVIASAAAPTYFPSWRYQGMNLVDGGVVAGNPVLIAYNEIMKENLRGGVDDVDEILSIGTGYKTHTYDTYGFGILEWIVLNVFGKKQTPLIDIFMQSSSQVAVYTLTLQNSDTPLFRFNTIDRELTDSVGMDETDAAKLQKLFDLGKEDGLKYLQSSDRFSGTGADIPEKPVTNPMETGQAQLQ